MRDDSNITKGKVERAEQRIEDLERSLAGLTAQVVFLREHLAPQSLETMMELRVGALG